MRALHLRTALTHRRTYWPRSQAVLPSHDEILIRKPSEICSHYAKTWLLLDVIAAVPYFYLACGLDAQCGTTSSSGFAVPLLSLLCCLRLTRIARSESARVLLLLPARSRNEASAPSRHEGHTALLRLAGLFLWMSHAAGCLYWYTSVAILREGLTDPKGALLHWGRRLWLPSPAYAAYLEPHVAGLRGVLANVSVARVDTLQRKTVGEAYAFSLMWGLLHVSGISFIIPDEPRGVLCVIVVGIAAIVTNATLIGFVTTTLTRINAYRTKELQGRENITAYLADNKVPVGLQKRIHEYYDFCGGVSRQGKTQLPKLPKALGFQLDIFLKRNIFLRVPFFQGCSVPQILALAPLIQSEHMMPGRIFVRHGHRLEGMYLVSRGKVLLQDADGEITSTRFAGGIIGESSLLQTEMRAPWTCAPRPPSILPTRSQRCPAALPQRRSHSVCRARPQPQCEQTASRERLA